MNLDVVVSSIGHEIKQPLMVITTCITIIEGLLRKPEVDMDDVKLNLDDVKSASVRIAETIDSLRGLFKNPQEAHQPIDVNELALDSLKTLDAELSSHDIAVTTELARACLASSVIEVSCGRSSSISCRTRSTRWRRSPAGADVTDPYELHAKQDLITIEDSGDGIDAERLPNLFTAAITTKKRGMGLGLSLCQMIVDRHNGQLSVSSDVGKGTRFEITLPCEPPAATESPSRIPAGSTAKLEAS